MKRYGFLVLAFVFILVFAACNRQVETPASFMDGPSSNGSADEPADPPLASFSYEEDAAKYRDKDPGVNPKEFVNVDICPIENPAAAVERAKNECTMVYHTASAYYDATADMWRVDFLPAARSEDGAWATAGNCQSVYMTSDGVTQRIVYGE